MTRKLRILLAKFGDGYEGAMLKLARSCSEAGFEVIYTDVQEPEAIVAAAIQESVDHVGITTLPGATVESFRKLFELLAKEGVTDIRVTAGGIFPDEDIAKIRVMGLLDFYPRNAIYDKIAQWRAAHAESP
ncbi:MAG: methylmalonyl-CoA mutase [Syntrophobacteraceae bacterium]|nr:methylmalonyl-CoA mutase [Syntrophobacteraceae bacterium]